MEAGEKVQLAVALTAMNNMRTLPEVFDSIAGLAQRMVMIDSGSTDGSREFAEAQGCTVIHRGYPGPAPQVRFACEQALPAHWILWLDSDESLDPELRAAVERVLQDDDPGVSGYMINRKLRYQGALLSHMLQPEWRLRLFRPEHTQIVGKYDRFHPKAESSGRVLQLPGFCIHDSYLDLEDALARGRGYGRRVAGLDRRGRWRDLVGSVLDVVLRHLFRQQAWRDGRRGLLFFYIALINKLTKQAYLVQHRLETEARGDAGNAAGASPPPGAGRERSETVPQPDGPPAQDAER